MTRALAALLISALALPAQADEVEDLLTSALQAYRDGDIQFALDDLDMARNALMAMKTASLGSYLPEAPAGWTREVDSEMNAGLAMMGGGVGAEATYTSGDGQQVKLTLMADNPMVSGMATMIQGAAMMGLKVERIERQRFAIQDGQMMGLVGNRVLVQTEGDLDVARSLLGQMDFDALAGFGD